MPPIVLSNGKIVFNQITEQNGSLSGSQIWIMNPDGTGQSVLFNQFLAFVGLFG